MLFNTKKMKGKDVLGIFGWRGSVGQDKIGSSRIGNGQQDRQAGCVYGTDKRVFTTKFTKGAKRRKDILPQRAQRCTEGRGYYNGDRI